MPVHFETISATSSSSTSSLSIRWSPWSSSRRLGALLDLAARGRASCRSAAARPARGRPRARPAPPRCERCSSCSLSARISRDGVLLVLPVRDHRVALLGELGELRPRSPRAAASTTASVSLASAAFSISSWRMRRSTTSISIGIESISMRRRDAASSTRSIALSGSWRAGDVAVATAPPPRRARRPGCARRGAPRSAP